MDELFGIDAQARQEGLSQIDRHALRLDKSKRLLEEIRTSIQAARSGALPKSALAKACDYTLTLWSRLSRFLDYETGDPCCRQRKFRSLPALNSV
jgi:hypothetical protein